MHRNAKLTPLGRRTLVERIQQGRPVAHVADEMGVSRATGYKWWGRFRREGWAGLEDRSSRPRSCPHQTPRVLERRIEQLRRRHRLPARERFCDLPSG
jgi:transposase